MGRYRRLLRQGAVETHGPRAHAAAPQAGVGRDCGGGTRSAPFPLRGRQGPTGVIAALLLSLADVVPSAIAADYAASTANLRDAYLRRYADGDPAAIIEAVRCPEEAVYNMLDFLGRAGGTRGYLAGIGLGADEITRLRARLRQ
ncbi:MAG: tyrosine-protein phosphatase [Steroidobacteraceae bacterium]